MDHSGGDVPVTNGKGSWRRATKYCLDRKDARHRLEINQLLTVEKITPVLIALPPVPCRPRRTIPRATESILSKKRHAAWQLEYTPPRRVKRRSKEEVVERRYQRATLPIERSAPRNYRAPSVVSPTSPPLNKGGVRSNTSIARLPRRIIPRESTKVSYHRESA